MHLQHLWHNVLNPDTERFPTLPVVEVTQAILEPHLSHCGESRNR